MKRQKTNNKLFLKLCKEGKSDEQILKAMGWKVRTAKSKADPTKRVRAYRWTAIHKGLNVDGKLVRLGAHRKGKGVAKAKKVPQVPQEATG